MTKNKKAKLIKLDPEQLEIICACMIAASLVSGYVATADKINPTSISQLSFDVVQEIITGM